MYDMFDNNEVIAIGSDLFGSYLECDNFLWAVGVFSGNGASEVIKYALDAHIEIFFPHRLNRDGAFIPLWRNYLFIEYRRDLTVQVCRQSSKFINFISFDTENNQPELVARDSIDEVLRLLKMGKYNHIYTHRAYIERGSTVRINDNGYFDGKIVRVLCDITPTMSDDKRVPVHFGNLKMMIEIGKLRI